MLFVPRRIVLVTAALVVVVTIVYLFAPSLLVWGAGYWVHARTGRHLTVEEANIEWGREIAVDVAGIALSNASWSREPVMVKVRHLRLRIPIASGFQESLSPSELNMEGAEILLERSGDQSNWSFPRGPKPHPFLEWDGLGSVDIREFHLRDLHLRYRGAAWESDIEGSFSEIDGRQVGESLQIRGGGVLDHKSFELETDLRRGRKNEWLRINARLGKTRLEVSGPHAGELALHASGNDLREAFPLLPIPFPSTPDYDFTARIRRLGSELRVRNLAGRLGQSDIAGELNLDLTREPISMSGKLHSETLFLGDMKGFIGLPVHRPPPKPEKLFPDNPINVKRFQRLELTLDYDADALRETRLPLDNWRGHVRISEGRLTIAPLHIDFAGGDAAGEMILDVTPQPAAASLSLQLHGLHLSRLVKKLPILDASRGAIGGEARITGEGASLADIFAAGHGRVLLLMTGGEIDHAFIDVAGGDLVRLLSKEKKAPASIRCALSVFHINGGIATADAFVIDTEGALITGRGRIDLRSEQMDLSFIATSKEATALSSPSPIRVRGSFKKPKISHDTSGLQQKGIAALALGALLGPLAALPPLIQPGTDEELACGELTRRFKQREN